jgi:hypothetical protein
VKPARSAVAAIPPNMIEDFILLLSLGCLGFMPGN